MRVERLKCATCGKAQHNNSETAKCRMEESERATAFLKATNHLMDEVFPRVDDLQDVFDVFAVEIRYHSACIELYLRCFEILLSASSHLPRVSKKRTTFKIEIERIKVILAQGNEDIKQRIFPQSLVLKT